MKNHYCLECGKKMNPVDYIIGVVCKKCCDKNRAGFTGQQIEKFAKKMRKQNV